MRFRTVVVLLLAAPLLAATAASQDIEIELDVPQSGTISAPGEIDWYFVTTSTVGDLAITQTAWPPFIESQIAVFGPGNKIDQQANPVRAAAPGTYYIKVWSANNGTSTDVYTFVATLDEAPTGNDIDGGANAPESAVPIAIGAAVSDTIAPSFATSGVYDVDWFSLSFATVGDLTVTQTAWPGFIESQIAVYGPDDPALAQSNPVLAAAPGTYYVKVWSANGGSSIEPYSFTTSLVTAATGNDVDGGANAPGSAVPIAIGAAVSDTIAPSFATSGVHDVDWFSLSFATVGDLTVTQTAWPGFIESQIAVYGPGDPALAQSNPVLAAAPGTYYVKVWSANGGSSIEPYSFTTSLVTATTGNDIDGGANSSSGAVPITHQTTVADTIAPSLATSGTQDEDWFVFATPMAGDLSVTQTQWPPFIETMMAVFGPDSPTLPFAGNPAPKGTYWVHVWSGNGGSSIAPYEFETFLAGDDVPFFFDDFESGSTAYWSATVGSSK